MYDPIYWQHLGRPSGGDCVCVVQTQTCLKEFDEEYTDYAFIDDKVYVIALWSESADVFLIQSSFGMYRSIPDDEIIAYCVLPTVDKLTDEDDNGDRRVLCPQPNAGDIIFADDDFVFDDQGLYVALIEISCTMPVYVFVRCEGKDDDTCTFTFPLRIQIDKALERALVKQPLTFYGFAHIDTPKRSCRKYEYYVDRSVDASTF